MDRSLVKSTAKHLAPRAASVIGTELLVPQEALARASEARHAVSSLPKSRQNRHGMGSREAQITVDVHNQSAISYEQFQSHEELQVLRAIVAREAGIDELLQYCCSFEDDVGIELLEAVLRVRQLSLNVIDAVAGWRRRMVAKKPFLWRNVNYLLKMTSDLDFLSSE